MAGPIVLPPLGPSIFHAPHPHLESPISATRSPTNSVPYEPRPSRHLERRHSEGVLVAIVGAGEAGIALIKSFASQYKIIAFDPSESRIKGVQTRFQHNSHISCSQDPRSISQATHILITVSSIVTPTKNEVDTSSLKGAVDIVSAYGRPGATVVIESSVPVGTTRQMLEALMTTNRFKCGVSPERAESANGSSSPRSTPKMISGLDEESLAAIQELYSAVFDIVVSVPQPEVAEMTALYENAQRMMSIALANEMADACRQLSVRLTRQAAHDAKGGNFTPVMIDPREVAQTTSTRRTTFNAPVPSLGVDDSNVSDNTYRLLSSADFPLLSSCTKRMRERPARLGNKLMSNILVRKAKMRKMPAKLSQPRVLIIGMGYKKGRSTLTPSPGQALAQHLQSSYDVHLEFADPAVQKTPVPHMQKMDLDACWTEEHLSKYDAIAVAGNLPELDMQVLEDAEDSGVYVEWYCTS